MNRYLLSLGFLTSLVACGGRQLPLSTIVVDAAVAPLTSEIPGIESGEPARPIAAFENAKGVRTEFVANEILLVTAREAELDAVVARWTGTVLSVVDLASMASGEPRKLYRIRVVTSSADTARLPALMREADDGSRSDLIVSSGAGVTLLTAVASEGVDHGLRVTPNFLWQGATVQDRNTAEAPSSTDGRYASDAFTWSQFKRGEPVDIGVGEAWRILADSGRANVRVPVAVADGGFAPDADFSLDLEIVPASFAGLRNPSSCTGGRPCPFHGTGVAQILGGLIDNNIGAAGTGGQVARLTMVASPAPDFFAYISYIIEGIAPALGRGIRLLNISAGAPIDAVVWALTFGTVDAIIAAVRASGLVIVAAAGNDGRDIDEEDCIGDRWICWEDAVFMPCELNGVVCVGGLAYDSLTWDSSSNWGSKKDANSVEIYAPFWNWVGSNPDFPANEARLIAGTSGSTPFVTGILAMILAANRSLSSDAAVDLLLDSARTSTGRAYRIVRAYHAVTRGLGGNAPPFVRITSPTNGASFPRGSTSVRLEAFVEDHEDSRLAVAWRSHVDGIIGTASASTSTRSLSIGDHTISVTVSDGTWAIERTVPITITGTRPVVDITSPVEASVNVYRGQVLELIGTSYDPSELAELDDLLVSWRVGSATATPFATGHSTSTSFSTTGTRVIYFVGTNGVQSSSASLTVNVSAPPANLPPTASISSPAGNVSEYPETHDDTGYYLRVALAGTANDPETGAITGTSLVWAVRRQTGPSTYTAWQNVGTGVSLQHDFYAVDGSSTVYQVRLIASDAAGNPSSAVYRTVTVRVLM